MAVRDWCVGLSRNFTPFKRLIELGYTIKREVGVEIGLTDGSVSFTSDVVFGGPTSVRMPAGRPTFHVHLAPFPFPSIEDMRYSKGVIAVGAEVYDEYWVSVFDFSGVYAQSAYMGVLSGVREYVVQASPELTSWFDTHPGVLYPPKDLYSLWYSIMYDVDGQILSKMNKKYFCLIKKGRS